MIILKTIPVWAWALIILAAMYLARAHMHRAIAALGRGLHHISRLFAFAASRASERISARNRSLLLENGAAERAQLIESELHSAEREVRGSLASYPALERRIREHLDALERDYQESHEVPPEPTSWGRAVAAIAEIPARNDPVVGDVLETIHYSMRKAEKKSLVAYRDAAEDRHHLLKRLMPAWRRVGNALLGATRAIDSLNRRARRIDQHVEAYKQIREQQAAPERMLALSALTRFVLTSALLLVAAAAAVVQFRLVAQALPGLEAVPTGIAGISLPAVTAGVLIAAMITAGLVVLESRGVTRFFPAIRAMDVDSRRTTAFAAAGLGFAIAAVSALLAARSPQGALSPALPDVAGMAALRGALAFLMAYVMFLAAAPLEKWLFSSRILLGGILSFSLRGLAFAARLSGNLTLRLMALMVIAYDIVIFLPLWLERVITDAFMLRGISTPRRDRVAL